MMLLTSFIEQYDVICWLQLATVVVLYKDHTATIGRLTFAVFAIIHIAKVCYYTNMYNLYF